jgi:hypothetical protein
MVSGHSKRDRPIRRALSTGHGGSRSEQFAVSESLGPSPGIPNTRKHNVSELDLFPSSGAGGKTSTLLGHWTSLAT